MHMVHADVPGIPVLFADTGVHFTETNDLRNLYAERFNLNIETLLPERSFEQQYADFGRYLHESDDSLDRTEPGYNHCCYLRKEVPFVAAVKGRFDAVIGGLMRAEGGRRGNTDIVGYDPRIDAYKIYPLAYATDEEVDRYVASNELPLHPLYAKGYTSIGCLTCTTPVLPGEDRRAGRWRHISEKKPAGEQVPLYCGINLGERK